MTPQVKVLGIQLLIIVVGSLLVGHYGIEDVFEDKSACKFVYLDIFTNVYRSHHSCLLSNTKNE